MSTNVKGSWMLQQYQPEKLGCGLIVFVGSGKSLQSIVLLMLAPKPKGLVNCIMVPSATIDKWITDLEQAIDTSKPGAPKYLVCYPKTRKDVEKLSKTDLEKYDIILTTYRLFQQAQMDYNRWCAKTKDKQLSQSERSEEAYRVTRANQTRKFPEIDHDPVPTVRHALSLLKLNVFLLN